MFFVSFGTLETQIWMQAYGYAQNVYGAPMGATLAHTVLGMLNGMRAARRHTFNFTNPRCAACSRISTPEERYLMDAFRSVRAGKPTQARISAMMLCEGNDPAEFLAAAAWVTRQLAQIPHSPPAF